MKEMYYSVRGFFYRTLDFFKYPNYYFFSRIKSVFYWLPIIWKDRGFDFGYAETILHHKIKQMIKYFEKCVKEEKFGVYVNIENDIRYMKILETLLERSIDDFYSDEWHNKVEETLGKSEFKFVETEDKDKNGEKLYEMIMLYDGIPEDELSGELQKFKKDSFNLMIKRQNKNNALIYKILQEKGKNWWI